MKKMTRILQLVFLGLLILVLCILWYFIFISKGTIRPYYDEHGTILDNSIAEKCYVEINGVKNGMFIRGKNLDNPVLLLVSSGPGTPDYFLNEAYPEMNLEDYYTVCYWEYRGSCLSYDSSLDPKSITTEQLVSDTLSITDYLRNRFQKEKIFILGFSGGSYIALNTIAKHPEPFYAYYGMAQLICHGSDNDTLMYEFMKDKFDKTHDKKRLKQLEQLVIHQPNNQVKCKEWGKYVMLLHEAGGGTIKDKSEFTSIVLPILTSRCYTMHEKINYIRGMMLYRTTSLAEESKQTDFRQSVPKVDLPMYFFSGVYDYNTPWPLVMEYCQQLDAPKKNFYSFDNSAHSPLWEQPNKMVPILKDIADELIPNSK